MNTLRCHVCGERVREKDSVRREVKIGKSGGSWQTGDGGVGFFNQTHKGMVDVCLDCNDELERQTAEYWKIAWIVGGVVGTMLFVGLIIGVLVTLSR